MSSRAALASALFFEGRFARVLDRGRGIPTEKFPA